jgi:hypothetical protein
VQVSFASVPSLGFIEVIMVAESKVVRTVERRLTILVQYAELNSKMNVCPEYFQWRTMF